MFYEFNDSMFDRLFLNQYGLCSGPSFGIGVFILNHNKIVIGRNLFGKVKVSFNYIGGLVNSELYLAYAINTQFGLELNLRKLT